MKECHPVSVSFSRDEAESPIVEKRMSRKGVPEQGMWQGQREWQEEALQPGEVQPSRPISLADCLQNPGVLWKWEVTMGQPSNLVSVLENRTQNYKPLLYLLVDSTSITGPHTSHITGPPARLESCMSPLSTRTGYHSPSSSTVCVHLLKS